MPPDTHRTYTLHNRGRAVHTQPHHQQQHKIHRVVRKTGEKHTSTRSQQGRLHHIYIYIHYVHTDYLSPVLPAQDLQAVCRGVQMRAMSSTAAAHGQSCISSTYTATVTPIHLCSSHSLFTHLSAHKAHAGRFEAGKFGLQLKKARPRGGPQRHTAHSSGGASVQHDCPPIRAKSERSYVPSR